MIIYFDLVINILIYQNSVCPNTYYNLVKVHPDAKLPIRKGIRVYMVMQRSDHR